MLRSDVLSASATAIMVLATVAAASPQRLLEKDGIELRGTARAVTYAAGSILLCSYFVGLSSSLPRDMFSSHDRHEAKGKRLPTDAGEVFEVTEKGVTYFEELLMRE